MSYLNISVSADLSPREDQTKFSDALSAWTRETSPSSPGPSPAVAWTCPWLWLWARNCKLVTLLAHQLSTALDSLTALLQSLSSLCFHTEYHITTSSTSLNISPCRHHLITATLLLPCYVLLDNFQPWENLCQCHILMCFLYRCDCLFDWTSTDCMSWNLDNIQLPAFYNSLR